MIITRRTNKIILNKIIIQLFLLFLSLADLNKIPQDYNIRNFYALKIVLFRKKYDTNAECHATTKCLSSFHFHEILRNTTYQIYYYLEKTQIPEGIF